MRVEKSDVTKTRAFGESSNISRVCIASCSTAVYRECITCTSETNFSVVYIFRLASIVVGLFIICGLLGGIDELPYQHQVFVGCFTQLFLHCGTVLFNCLICFSTAVACWLVFFFICFDWLLVLVLQVSVLLGLFPLLRFLN